MCGIAGIYLKNPDKPYLSEKEKEQTVDWLLCGIEHRGKDATGIAVQSSDGTPYLEKSDMAAGRFIFWRRDLPENSRTILLHTRLATKGKPENLLNNHPIEYKNIMAIHNGHISNDDELFAEQELERIAEVDSEIIPALFHKYTFDNPKDALEKMSGGFAIAVIDSENPGKLILAKGSSSPLHYIETAGMFVWASEPKVILESLKYGLSFEAEDDDIKELKYGQYMLIDGEDSSIEDFKPYYKTWTPSKGATSYVTRSYDGWHRGETESLYGRNQCDECFVWYSEEKLNKIGREYFCDHCEAKLYDIDKDGLRIPKNKKLSRKEKKRLRKQKAREFQESKSAQTTIIIPKKSESIPQGIAEALDNEHWAVCQLVAEFYSTKPDFVDFMLFGDQDIEDFDDPNLVTMFMEFEGKYKEILEEVRGETDKIMEEISCKPFPVGFGGI